MSEGQQNIPQGPSAPTAAAVQNAPNISVPKTGVSEIASAGDYLTDQHLAFAEFQEGYVRNYISLADTKAAWAFTIASGILVYLIGNDKVRPLLFSPTCLLTFGLAWLSVALLALSAFFAFRVIAPRLGSPSGEGIVFFGAVSKHASATAYIDAVESRSESDLIEARLRHCFDVSRVCDGKYESLKKSIWIGFPALLVSLALLLKINS